MGKSGTQINGLSTKRREGNPPMKMIAVIQLSWEPDWFSLDLRERTAMREQLAKILTTHPGLNCRWFDSEPWTGRIAEFFVCEFGSLRDYWKLWNELREHRVFSGSFARIRRVTLGVERKLLEDKVVSV